MITTFPYSALRGFCRRIYGDIPLLLTPTVYLLSFGTMTPLQQKTVTAQINANCDFLLLGFSADVPNTSGTLQLTDSSNSMTLFSSPTPVNSIGGSVIGGAPPQSLHYPYWIGQNSAFIAQYQNENSGLDDLSVSLIGMHVRELR